jgi:multidrug efflux pump subunit AcrA (membrane-fusion protein)
MKRFRKVVWLVILAGAAGGVWLARGHLFPGSTGAAQEPAPAEAPAAQEQRVAVTVAAVTARPIQRKVRVVGTLYGFDEVSVTPKVEGRIQHIYHDVSDVVRPGEPLLQIDETDYRLVLTEMQRGVDLELARLGLDRMPPDSFDVERLPSVIKAGAVQKNAYLRFARARRSGEAISTEDRETYETDSKVAEASYRQALLDARATLASVRQRQAQVDTVRQRLLDTRLIVPVPTATRLREAHRILSLVYPEIDLPTSDLARRAEYVVAQRMVSEGEMVRSSSGAAFRLVMVNPLRLLATVPERHVSDIQDPTSSREPQRVEMTVEAYPGQVFHGRIARVNPTVDRTSRTFQVEVLVPNKQHRLRAGSFARATVFTREEADVTTVPEESLVHFAGVTKVFVVRSGVAHDVPVETGERLKVAGGKREQRWVEVAGDLRPGDTVVTSGHSQLADRTPVRVR